MEKNQFKMEGENMITKEELKDYAKTRNLNLGQAEKDYMQTILLFIIYLESGKSMVFKGGTAMSKCYGLNRFSEDLDFTCENEFNIEIIEKGLKRFRINYEMKKKKYPVGLKIVLRIKGPLYIGIRNSLCRFELDLSFRENVKLQPKLKTIGRHIEEIPEFQVYAMQEKEILAEKIRAILARDKARDVYDLWFLLKKGIEFDLNLVEEKLKYYHEKWDKNEFMKKLEEKKNIWATELTPLIKETPEFKEVKDYIKYTISGGKNK